MAEVNTFACDVCGVQKKECNRWWIVWIAPGGRFSAREFDVDWWGHITDRDFPRAVACGEEHAQQLFARWLVGSQTPGASPFDAPSQRKITAENAKDAEQRTEKQETPAPPASSAVKTSEALPLPTTNEEESP